MSWLSDKLKETWADINIFDGGKSAATIKAARTSPPPASLPNKNLGDPIARQAEINANKNILTSKPLVKPNQNFMDKILDVTNPNSEMDKYNRQMAGLPADYHDQSIASKVSRGFQSGGLSTARVFQGLVQDTSGLYDLITPGEGTNRVTKFAKNLGAETDKAVERRNLDTNAYRAAQVPINAAAFMIPSVAYEKAATTFPKVASASTTASRLVNKVPGATKLVEYGGRYTDDLVKNGNVVQRVAGNMLKSYARPGTVSNVTVDALQNAGRRTSLEQDNSAATFGLDLGMSLATQGATNLVGQANTRLVKTPLRNYNLIRPLDLNDSDVLALGNYVQSRSGLNELSEQGYQAAKVAAQKAGLDLNDTGAIDDVVKKFRHYDIQKGYRKENLANLKQAIDDKASLGFAMKPIDNQGNPTKGFEPRPFSERGSKREIPDFADPAVKLPSQKQSRFANTTVQNSDEVSDPLKKMVREENVQYTPTTNKARIDEANKVLNGKTNDQAFTETIQRFENRTAVNDQDIVTGIQLAKRLDASGTEEDLFKASELFDSLSRTLTEKGQSIQAASLLSARSPQGLFYTAQKNLRKNGVEVSPAIQKDLKNLIDQVKKQKPGTYEDGLARYKVMEYVSKKVPSRNSSKILQVWKAGLLSAPRTTAGNIAANTAETIFKKGYVDPIANMTDALISIFPGMKRSRSMTAKGLTSGFTEGIDKGIKYFKTGYDPRNPMTKFDVRDIHFSDTAKGRAAEKYTQTIFRLMGAQDQPFYYANLRNSIADQAITEAKNKGLKGTQRNDFIKKFITEPDKKVLELADKEARYSVFQNETALSKAASKLKGADGVTGDVAEFVMPFSGVPSSVATRMIERTPIGTATEIIKQISSKKYDQRALTQAIANGSAVIPLVGAGKALANSGLITLGYPKDQTERDLWELEGKTPYSIKVGGKWRSLNYFQPAGTLIASGAEYAQRIKDGGSPSEALASAMAGGGKSLTEQSFLKGVSGALNALTDPQRAGEKFLEQTVGSIVPNISRSLANATDKVKREQDNLSQTLKSGIPGLRQSLPARNNIYGEEIPNQASPLEIGLNPTKPSNVLGQDSLTQELRRLKDADQGVTTTKLKNTKDMKFTPEQQRELDKQVGSEIKTTWNSIISDPRYADLADEDKNKILRDASESIFGARKKEFMAKYSIGEFAPDFKGKESKLDTKQKRILEGKSNDYLSKSAGEATYSEQYADKLKKYQEEAKDLSPVERIKKEKEIAQLKVKKDFDQDTVNLYGLSKAEAYDYLSNSPDGKALAKKMLAYGDALVKAGLTTQNKFRNKNGSEAIKPTTSSGGGGSRSIGDVSLYSGSGATALSLRRNLQKLLDNAKIGGKKA